MASSKCVLVIDDDTMVADVVALMLQELGYRTIVEHSSQAGLDAFSDGDILVDIVITDLTMPKMNGVTLATRMKQVRPAIPVFVMSGHARTALAANDTGSVDRFLTKPLRLEELKAALDAALPQ